MRRTLSMFCPLGAAAMALLAGCARPAATIAAATAADAPTKQLIATLQPMSLTDRRQYFVKHPELYDCVKNPAFGQQVTTLLQKQ